MAIKMRKVAVGVLLSLACGPGRSSDGDGGSATDDGGTGGDDGGTGEDDGGTGEDDGGTGDSGGDDGNTTADDGTGTGVGEFDAVDILFVIDNTGSMGEEQETLAASFAAFIDVLEEGGAAANYRIGITTTDNGNPWCSGTTPEGGALRLRSCLSRLPEFTFTGTDPPTNMEAACTNVCPDQWASIETTPTTTEGDATPSPRPWIENTEGSTNLPAGLSMVQAFQCLAPQGINGCGFESHLESMYKALARAESSVEDSYGFIREEALLAVVFVSDEVDCSNDGEHDTIFLPDGNRVFWSDPDAAYPTSAVCWNAGVSCSGGPGTYDECHAENKDVDGNSTDDSQAVLEPLSRYVGRLSAHPTIVFGLLGVPEGYAGGQDIVYQDAEDGQFHLDYGIGPGCESATGIAVPPVRIRELAASFADGSSRPLLYSICADSYAPALEAIATRLK
jgi:hypothetical protein